MVYLLDRNVFLRSVRPEGGDIEEIVGQLCASLGVLDEAGGGTVVVKPNFCVSRRYETGITADLRILESLIKIFSRDCDVKVCEGVGRGYAGHEVFGKTGVKDLCTSHGIELLDLDEEDRVDVKVENPRCFSSLSLPRVVVDAEYLVNLPVLKTHNQTRVSLGLKNMFGVLSQIDKANSHFLGLEDAISDIYSVVKPDLTVMDGVYCVEGNGPIAGSVRKCDLILACDDSLAGDWVACQLMGFDPMSIRHVRIAAQSCGLSGDDVRVDGEVKSLNFKPPVTEFEYIHPVIGKLKKTFIQRYVYFTRFRINRDKCVGCGVCVRSCPQEAIDGDFVIDVDKCRNCNICREFCPHGAVEVETRFGLRNLL